ncbi:RNA-binding protein [Rhodanobacter sp. FW510-R12]|uniref:ASCH domain-containing protein n=1 Tax=unclassified Rhodanobacter TaxID=2621553 RepID=UPI0007AA5129|nr:MULTISPECIES: ASCH domain-containing protein [unclassified Rhodanobacter]KZC17965.1 RNA-binding protein [Rhodanobacter sp. FW104-R8]KZC25574.1 RNA-binding protein [Rhodanobacter sp. FW510-T8]KZC32777.1 RNA-binding protein [Rhodanobacter sp. FW510-R10]
MLALSIVAPNGANIAAGRKTLEIRTWRPPRLPLRDLLIVENRIFLTGEDETDPDGIAVAVVDVEEVHAWQPSELQAACASRWTPDMWAWHVTHVRPIGGAFRIAARRKLYEVRASDALLERLGRPGPAQG